MLKILRLKEFILLIYHWKLIFQKTFKPESQNLFSETFDPNPEILFTQTIDPNNSS